MFCRTIRLDFMAGDNNASAFAYVAAVIAIFVFGMVVLISMVHQNGAASGTLGHIEVAASGYAYGTADQAVVLIEANGTGNTSQQAVSNLAATLDQLNTTVLGYVNGNLSNVQTQSLSTYYQQCYPPTTYPAYNYTVPSTTTITYSCRSHYVAQESMQVTLQSTMNVGSLVANVSSIPNVLVSSVYPRISAQQATSLRDAALKNALANATQQAIVLANGGTNLTVLNVSVSNYFVYPMALGASVQSASGPAYYSGRYQVDESINAQFSYTR